MLLNVAHVMSKLIKIMPVFVVQGHEGKAKPRPAYAMLGRMEVPAGAAGADPERRGAADAGGRSEQPSPGRASASREVYILAAADAVEDALNSHRVLRMHPCRARQPFICLCCRCPFTTMLSRTFWHSEDTRLTLGLLHGDLGTVELLCLRC